MTRLLKAVLAGFLLILLGLVVLGTMATSSVSRMAWSGLGRTMVWDAAAVDAIAHGIVSFDLPPGYKPEYGMSMLGLELAAYTPGDGQSHLIITQIPRWLPWGEAEIARMARDSMTDEAQMAEAEITLIEEREIRVGDAIILYAIHEGTNDQGEPFRSLETLFPGRNGPVILFFEEPLSRWDDAQAKQLLASLR